MILSIGVITDVHLLSCTANVGQYLGPVPIPTSVLNVSRPILSHQNDSVSHRHAATPGLASGMPNVTLQR